MVLSLSTFKYPSSTFPGGTFSKVLKADPILKLVCVAFIDVVKLYQNECLGTYLGTYRELVSCIMISSWALDNSLFKKVVNSVNGT